MTTIEGHDPEYTPVRELSHEEREIRRQAAKDELTALSESRLKSVAGTLGPKGAVTRLRVRAEVRPIDQEWIEVHLGIRLRLGQEWLYLTPPDAPLMIARFGVDGTDRQVFETYAISALRQALERDGAKLLGLEGAERRDMTLTTEWSYWAVLSGPLSVAVHTNPDYTVTVMGMP